MKSSYNKLGRFVLVLSVFFSIFGFPFVLASEEGNPTNERKLESFSENSPIDITDDSSNVSGANSQLMEEFTLRNGSETVSYTSHVIRLILSLIFVVFLAYLVIRFMKKSNLFVVNDDAYLKLVAGLNIEQGKSIKVFTLGEKAYIVGVTNNNITKIAEIEDKVLIDAMNLKASETSKVEVSSFNKVFSSFFPTSKNAEERIFSDDFLKNQQERIKNMDIKTELERKE